MFDSGLTKTLALIDQLTELTGRLIAWLTFLMVLVSFTIVVLRYGFDLGWIAMQESVLYLHALVFMLGAGYTLKADGHVRVDIFYQKFSPQQKAWVNLLGSLLLLLPVCVTLFMLSLDYVVISWRILEQSPEAGGLPIVYLNKTLMLLLSLSLGLQGIAEIIRNVNILTSPKREIK
jgi:TRAP-type mannitol/chloroaromatic compound transport system permease small subunit